MDQKLLFILLILSIISPTYYHLSNVADAFKGKTPSNDSEWKTFKDRNKLFTIQYPSDWSPGYTGESDKEGPIDVYFDGPGYSPEKGTEVAVVQYDAKSAFNSAKETLESELGDDKDDPELPGFQILSPIECVKYTLNEIQACSAIYEYKEGKVPQGVHVVDAVASDGTEYEAYFYSDGPSFKKDHPLFEEMIKTFKTGGNMDFNMTNTTSSNEGNTDLNMTNMTSSSDNEFLP